MLGGGVAQERHPGDFQDVEAVNDAEQTIKTAVKTESHEIDTVSVNMYSKS